MATSSDALTFLLLVFGGWVNRSQQRVIDYLLEENRVLREQLGVGAFGSRRSATPPGDQR